MACPLVQRSFLAVFLGLTTPALGTTITVTSTGDDVAADGSCTLREALQATNSNAAIFECPAGQTLPVVDTIAFNIPGAGVRTIAPSVGLPEISEAVIINGLTQPLASCSTWPPTLLIEIAGTNLAAGSVGLHISAGGASTTLRGLVINRFSGPAAIGILLGESNAILQCNFIGTNAAGTAAGPGNEIGVVIAGSASNCLIGTDGDGTGDATEANVISSNALEGMSLLGSDNIVAGNYIGTDATGTVDLGNGSQGVRMELAAQRNLIGTDGLGGSAAERNIIAGNSAEGVLISGNVAAFNVVAGNYIGTNASGTAAIPNSDGVFILAGSLNNRIGTNGDGTADAAERNVISGNTVGGVQIQGSGTTGNVVAGNFVGTDAGGTLDLGNAFGVVVALGAQNNRIGTNGDGTADAAEANVIAGSSVDGINLQSANTTGNVFAGNFIGTGLSGTANLGNDAAGIRFLDGPQNNVVGFDGTGTAAVEANTIKFNTRGVEIETSGLATTGNVIRANNIVQNTRGLSAPAGGVVSRGSELGSAAPGNGPTDNVIQDNLISLNAGPGVLNIGSSPSILGNTISANSGSGVLDQSRFGASASPATAADDFLSRPLIQNNTIVGNCTAGVTDCAGIFSLDTAPFNVAALATDNVPQANSGAPWAEQRWFGAAELISAACLSAAACRSAAPTAGPPMR